LSKRFGATGAEALELLLTARDVDLIPYGCTFHVGSQNTEVRSWEQPIAACARLMEDFERLTGTRLEMLDIGGGWPAQYAGAPVPTIAEIGSSIRRSLGTLPYPVELVAEPGRALVADAATLVTSVIGKRRRRDATWVHLDAGPYTGLMEAPRFLGGEPFPISCSGDKASEPTTSCILTGPTCDDGDIVQDDVALPSDLEVGGRVYIGTAGAYSSTLATSFNGFAPPSTNFVDEQDLVVVEPTDAPVEEHLRLWQGGPRREIWGFAANRFRSLPMARSAVLVGRTASDIFYNSTSILVMSLTGLIVGWRIRTSIVEAIGGFLLLLLFAYAFSWIMAYVGLKVSSVEVVNNASFMFIFPLTFIANTFVDINRLPGPLKTFAEWNPVSAVAQAVREAFGNTSPVPEVWSLENPIAYALIWVGIILAVFVPLSVRQYNKAASR